MDAILQNTRWIVSGTAFAVLLYNRNASTAACIGGAILNAILAKILKRVFRVSRPEGAKLKDGGMPSSHAQSLMYFSVCVSQWIWEQPWRLPIRSALAIVLLDMAMVAANWRVKEKYHTRAQILVGGAIGSVFSIAWYRNLTRIMEATHLVEWFSGNNGVLVIGGIIVIGALSVGSIERKIAKMVSKK